MNSKENAVTIIDLNSSNDFEIYKALKSDAKGILNVAASVGNTKNNPNKGYLIADYSKDRKKHILTFQKDIERSNFFYVLKRKKCVVGFLLARQKDNWLQIEPKWIFDTNWKDDFDKNSLENFIILEKIAVDPNLAGKGLGTKLFNRFEKDAISLNIKDMFSETILSPQPNFASMRFAIKQKYKLAGIRYEKFEFESELLTTIVYHKTFSF